MLATLWIIVGSYWFSQWWYVALFDGQWHHAAFLAAAISYLYYSQSWLLFSILGLGVVTILLYSIFPAWSRKPIARLLRLTDRFGTAALLLCIIFVAGDPLILEQTQHTPGPLLLWMWAAHKYPGLHPEAPPPAQIAAPVDFGYLDAAAIDALQSQIEPSLVESSLTISNGNKGGMSAGVDVGAIDLEEESSRTKRQTTGYLKSGDSTERKCIELMNFGLKNGRFKRFTDLETYYEHWGIRQHATMSDSKRSQMNARKFLTGILLQYTHGFVIVDGVFSISRHNGRLYLQEVFSPSPDKVIFRFTLPEKVDASLSPGNVYLHIFGEVTPQRHHRGVLLIQPLAVYS